MTWGSNDVWEGNTKIDLRMWTWIILPILSVCSCMYLYVKYCYMFMIADLPKWLSQKQANIFAMQTAKQVQQLLWQSWWCILCQRSLYLHLQMSKFLLDREWSLNVEPQEIHSRRLNGQNIELALLSSNYHIFIFLGSHTCLWTCWFVRYSLIDFYYSPRCVSSYMYLTYNTHSIVCTVFCGLYFFELDFTSHSNYSVEVCCYFAPVFPEGKCLWDYRSLLDCTHCWGRGHMYCIQRYNMVMEGLIVMVIDGIWSCLECRGVMTNQVTWTDGNV